MAASKNREQINRSDLLAFLPKDTPINIGAEGIEINENLTISRSSFYQHFKGIPGNLVSREKRGRHVYYTIHSATFKKLIEFTDRKELAIKQVIKPYKLNLADKMHNLFMFA